MAAATAYTWRMGNDESVSAQHYDVGNFPANVDITDARQFAILECWFDQATAAKRAIAYNSGLAPPASWTAISGSKGSKPKPR